MQPSLCIGSLNLGQDFKWQEKTAIQDLCLFHGDLHKPPTQHQVSFLLKGIVDTKAVSLYMFDHWRWEAYSLDNQELDSFFYSVFGDNFDPSHTTQKALILQMNQQDNTVISLILYGQKKEQELVLYAHRLRQYHELASLKSIKEASTESASQSSLTEDRTLEEDMIEQLTETPIIMMPLPKPSSSQRPNRSHSQNTLPVRSQNNIYYANKNLFKQCIKHEFTRQGIQDAELSQVVYHDLIYHYKDKLHAHLLPEQQIQVSSKTFIDFHVNFKAMLSIK